jgi:hypothetical protein
MHRPFWLFKLNRFLILIHDDGKILKKKLQEMNLYAICKAQACSLIWEKLGGVAAEVRVMFA